MPNKIHPCLWFDGQAKAAADFYCSVFPKSKITADTPMVVNFELEGQKFMGLNGGPMFKINPSISMFVTCSTNEEIESLHKKLSEGGSALMPLDKYPWSEKYAWIKDKFGLTWQLMSGHLPEGAPKLIPSLLFSNKQYGKAKKAIDLYTSIFPNSSAINLQFYKPGEAQPKGNLKFGNFILNGKLFAAMDGPGNHDFDFNEAISLVVECDTQPEIDSYWNKLIANGGQESMCGWLKDSFGISWQIIPSVLGKLMSDKDRGQRVMQALMKMKKLDIATLENA